MPVPHQNPIASTCHVLLRHKKNATLVVVLCALVLFAQTTQRGQPCPYIASTMRTAHAPAAPAAATRTTDLELRRSGGTDRQSLPGRLAEAFFVASELKRSQSYLQLICPSQQAIGERPSNHVPAQIGTLCEAWANREWMEVFWHVADRSMVALEWSSGSGTLWTLRRGLTLYTVEHCGDWLDDVKQHIETEFPQLTDRWFPTHISTTNGCDQHEAEDWEAVERVFGDYARFPRQHLQDAAPHGFFDVINIDGRFRDGCFVEAFDLVNPEYGMIILDNAERIEYKKPSEVPSHWLVVSFQTPISETSMWMACPSVEDARCEQARREISSMVQNLPPETVGNRYWAHMNRARADGVPGA